MSLDSQNLFPVVGMGWYQPETYQKCKKLFSDSDSLPDTYGEWLERAELVEVQLKAEGIRVIRAWFDPKTFPRWCKKNGFKKLDNHARTKYSAAKAQEWAQEHQSR